MALQPKAFSSHDGFDHERIDHLSFDWEKVGNPKIEPKHPFKLYLPRTTEDVVRAIKEASQLGQKLVVRSKGHSSNDLVLEAGGSIMLMQFMNQLQKLDEKALWIDVQGGAVLAVIDDYLSERGFGLPVIGDHNHITAGGFASVGGISPASHRHGLFIDNVLEMQWVDWKGQVHQTTLATPGGELQQLLASLGRMGVITRLRLRIEQISKYTTVLYNNRKMYTKMEQFVKDAQAFIEDPGDAVLERGVWLNLPMAGREMKLGMFSAYHKTEQSPIKRARAAVAYGGLYALGKYAGQLPTVIDEVLKYIGMLGVMFSPRWATHKNVEFFTDRILDSSVGDPTRMFIVLAPVAQFSALFHEYAALLERYRKEHSCMTFLGIYVKAIKSAYLARGGDPRFAELMLYVGIDPENMTSPILEQMVNEIDDLCIKYGGLRYMHSKTVKDERRLEKIDPNAYYSKASPELTTTAKRGGGASA